MQSFDTWLFNLSPFAAKYCLVMWDDTDDKTKKTVFLAIILNAA